MQRVLVTSQVNPRFAFAFMPASWIFSQKAVVFCIESYSGFGTIQSRVHEFWARYFSSTSIELMSYTASDCFETFPLPENWETHAVLEAAGKAYYEFRAALMIRTNEGLTKIYNRFHDPDDHAADLVTLRELHAEMDCAVLNAYGWADLRPTCEFILDYEEKEDEGIGPNSRRKPWRYRWPDEIRDEVLARLLELNRQRARAEAVAGEGQSSSARAKPSSGKSGRGKVSVEAPLVPGLLSEEKQ
jgi:hypothetical protein